MSSTLAIHGGTPVRTAPFQAWPVWDESDVEAVEAVVRSGRWGRLSGDRVAAFERGGEAGVHGGTKCTTGGDGGRGRRVRRIGHR